MALLWISPMKLRIKQRGVTEYQIVYIVYLLKISIWSWFQKLEIFVLLSVIPVTRPTCNEIPMSLGILYTYLFWNNAFFPSFSIYILLHPWFTFLRYVKLILGHAFNVSRKIPKYYNSIGNCLLSEKPTTMWI